MSALVTRVLPYRSSTEFFSGSSLDYCIGAPCLTQKLKFEKKAKNAKQKTMNTPKAYNEYSDKTLPGIK